MFQLLDSTLKDKCFGNE